MQVSRQYNQLHKFTTTIIFQVCITRNTVPFQSIRPSRVTGLLVLAEIRWLSHVTGEFTRGPSHPMMKKFLKRLCYVRNLPNRAGGRIQNFVHPVMGHTLGRID